MDINCSRLFPNLVYSNTCSLVKIYCAKFLKKCIFRCIFCNMFKLKDLAHFGDLSKGDNSLKPG